jgi:ketosteroid isomerase-like protein
LEKIDDRGGGVMAVDPNQRTSEQLTAELMDRWYAGWNAHNLDAIAACLTDDAVLEEPGAAEGLYRGPDAILAWGRATFRAAPDFHLDELERWITPSGDVITTYFKATGTFTGPFDPPGFAPTNGRLEFEGMDRSEIREGKIARHQIFYDLNGLARQMGAVPEPGSFGERLGVRMQHLAARRLRKRVSAPN